MSSTNISVPQPISIVIFDATGITSDLLSMHSASGQNSGLLPAQRALRKPFAS